MKLPAFLLFALLVAVLPSAAERPNIIFILADDMGYGDVQALNPESKIPTPNLNRMAEEGMTFTDAHSPSAVCTPTRYATLTGRYCWRSKLTRGVLNGYGEPLIEKDRPTVASYLKEQGYATGVVGKWHLGLGFQKTDGKWDWSKRLDYSPVDLGFDHSYVIPASLDFPPYVYVEGHEITGQPDRTQPKQGFPGFLREGELGADFSIIDCLDHLTEKAATHVTERAKEEAPFFLYFPLTAPHKPVSPHPRFEGQSGLGPYGDFILQVDWTVGEVLKAVDEAGIAENTAIFYTSDNGSFMYRETDPATPAHVKVPEEQRYFEGDHMANGPLRGTKADIWEAGHRVPFFVKWPKGIEAGAKCDRTICHVDLFATAAGMIGGKLPKADDAAPDSFDISPLFEVKRQKGWKRSPVIHHSGGAMFAIREGDWKLVLGNGSGGRQDPRGKRFERPWMLFNLAEDLGETTDLYDAKPEIARKLERTAMEMITAGKSR